MIGLDTNVLLRFYLADDPQQTAVVQALFDGLSEDRPGYVNMITLVELIWTLRVRFGIDRDRVAAVVSGLLESRDIVVEDEAIVEVALDHAMRVKAELPDLLIALRNIEAGCQSTLTFDRKAADRIPGMELLT